MAATSKAKLSLKLLVDTKNKRVLFAEAGKDFVDFLFHLLHLPVATVVRLLTKQNMVGTLGNIYESIENLSEANIQPNHTKYSLLKPIPPFSATQVRLSLDDSVPTKMYTCPHNNKARIMRPGPYGYKCYTHFHSYVANDERAVCPSCKVSLSKEIQYVAAAANEVPGGGGFVKGTGTYMVMDDLVVNPMSTLSGITILNKLCVKDVGALEEMVVILGCLRYICEFTYSMLFVHFHELNFIFDGSGVAAVNLMLSRCCAYLGCLLLRWTPQISPRHLCFRTVHCHACKMKSEPPIQATDGLNVHSSNPVTSQIS